NRELAIDPTSQALNGLVGVLTYLRGDVDAWYEIKPKRSIEERGVAPGYLMKKGDLELAQKVLDDRIGHNPEDYDLLMQRALLLALKGSFPAANKQITVAFDKVPHNN